MKLLCAVVNNSSVPGSKGTRPVLGPKTDSETDCSQFGDREYGIEMVYGG